jgi:hypothetical protein
LLATEFPSSAALLGDMNELYPDIARRLNKRRQVIGIRLAKNRKISHRCDCNYRPEVGRVLRGTRPIYGRATGHRAITGRVATGLEYCPADVRWV